MSENLPTTGNVSLVSFTHLWTIDDFESHCYGETSVKYFSPRFHLNSNLSMYLVVTIDKSTNDNVDDKSYLSIFVYMNNTDSQGLTTADVEFFLIDSKNRLSDLTNYQLPITHTFSPGQGWGLHDWVERDVVTDFNNKLLSNGRLSILCKIQILDNRIVDLPFDYSKKNLKKLFKTKLFSDMIFTVNGEDLKVHKPILAAKSPVFYSMFSRLKKGTNDNRIFIDDFDFLAMKEVMRYIYTGKTKNFESYVISLLAAADKYCIDDLKTLCCRYFCGKVNVQSAAKILALSYEYNVKNLGWVAGNFIDDHFNKVTKTIGYEEIKKTHPRLLMEFIRMMSLKKNKKKSVK